MKTAVIPTIEQTVLEKTKMSSKISICKNVAYNSYLNHLKENESNDLSFNTYCELIVMLDIRNNIEIQNDWFDFENYYINQDCKLYEEKAGILYYKVSTTIIIIN